MVVAGSFFEVRQRGGTRRYDWAIDFRINRGRHAGVNRDLVPFVDPGHAVADGALEITAALVVTLRCILLR
jgi:hypothetical protein